MKNINVSVADDVCARYAYREFFWRLGYLFDYKPIVAGKNQGGTAEYFVPCMLGIQGIFLLLVKIFLFGD